MSKSDDSLRIVAAVFELIQVTRDELLRRGGERNMRLAQVLEKGKDAMAPEFEKITLE